MSRTADKRPPDLRWNFGAGLIDAAGWGVGMMFVSPTTILPLFVGHLSASPVYAGLIQAVMLFGWLVPGILVSGFIERLPRVKLLVMAVAALERLMLLLLAGFCLWLGRDHPGLLLALFFTCWSVMNAAVGASTPAYYKLIAKTIPADYRGRLYGIGGAISGAVGVPAATLLAGRFLTEGGFPAGYAACFLAAFVAQALTVLPLAFMREPAQAPEHHPEPSTPLRTAALIRSDPRLFWLCAAVALFSLNQMAGGFYTLYAVHRFQAGEQAIAGFTAVLMGARVLAFLLIGWLGDRHGNRAALLAGAAGGAASAGLALAAPELSWLYLVFAVNEVAAQALGVSGMNYVLELCPPERVSSYTAVYGLFTGPFRVGLPLAAGWLAATAGYTPLFVLAAAGALLTAVLLVTRVPEPRALPVNAGMEAA